MPLASNFYPRPPRGGRLISVVKTVIAVLFLSTPSARRATQLQLRYECCIQISIHALREEGDSFLLFFGATILHFYPRPPRGGRPVSARFLRSWFGISIHALREEGDRAERGEGLYIEDFYPRPPRGGRLLRLTTAPAHHAFLSTPSARRATTASDCEWSGLQFLSTPSARRATRIAKDAEDIQKISIHALREEGDGHLCCYCRRQ